MQNGVILITYANSIGGNLKTLRSIINNNYREALTGIHLLPFYPSSGDRGFSPLNYETVDPSFGDWKDIASLGSDYELMADFMVNHLSRNSEYFEDWMINNRKSAYEGLFLPIEKIFGDQNPSKEVISKIYRRQPSDPWIILKFDNGEERKVWCTFSEDQIDIDITTEAGLNLFKNTIIKLTSVGIKMLRLDAVGYITKKQGTSCFMVEPDIWNILDQLKNIAIEYSVELLPEMHEHYTIQQNVASHGFPVYDFALPLILLYAHYGRDFSPLKQWLSICPRNQFTTLDTHDGIGVVDAADLLTQEQTDFTVEKLYSRGSNVKKKYSSAEYQNLDIYQINCTYYSALGEEDDAYILARSIQFFAPGTPQIYYVGMLAGKNDLELIERTRQGRDINRHDYTGEEISEEVERPVVKRLKALMEFRCRSTAFDGELTISGNEDSTLILAWKGDSEEAVLSVNLNTNSVIITENNLNTGESTEFHP